MLNCVMLIDDSAPDNLFHSFVIQDVGLTNNLIEFENGQEALDYLTRAEKDPSLELPNLIFLDLNMPVMDGFEFLERYCELPKSFVDRIPIIVASTSTMQSDKEKCYSFNIVKDFIEKPLKPEYLERIKSEKNI